MSSSGSSTTKLTTLGVAHVLRGMTCVEAAATTGAAYSTLTAHVRANKSGLKIREKGRPPALPIESEQELVEWIIGMQTQGLPLKRRDVIVRACKIGRRIHPTFKLGGGWYKRFRQRHPILTNRIAQPISRALNSVDVEGINAMFDLLYNEIKTYDLTPDRVWNMDETAFRSRKNGGKVVAVKGSRNAWLQTLDANYHLSVTACVRADGIIFPPTFILPGESIERSLTLSCNVPGATVTTGPKGWMNEDLFISWMKHFASAIPESY
ncbi:hypothetical protein LEN26_014710 [Aphanomyces euteiches]|nr:hypothetical protein LEN26_014710 [Aphanomyces euteiches]